MKDCIFCKSMNGEIPSEILFENESSFVIAPKEAESKGHLLVIPKEHCENIFDISRDKLNDLMKVIKHISEKLKDNWGIEGINILHASGKVAQQSVFHFHFHLIPRFENDGVDAWPKFDYEEKNRERIYKEIKEALK